MPTTLLSESRMPPRTPPSRRSKRGETPQERLAHVARAAFECISRTGYLRTQMADVAKAAGLSPAALYSYAKGKEGLLTLAIRHAIGGGLPDGPLPVTPMTLDEIVALSEQRIAKLARWRTLTAAIKADTPPTLATLRQIGADAYDLQSANRNGIWLIDKLSLELPEIEKLQATKMHGAFMGDLTKLIAKWAAPGIVPDVAARNAVEMLAWPSMHRHRDAWLKPDADEEAIRETALAQYTALLAATMRKKRS